ncbi:hypothetical protein LSTR_LSTR016248 [Laodelphax striatellus]|uniref:Death domain-containing protein n=1 Tax=Laodelphax striatellus TaxID=195883 RepID=A0A482XDJ5_LAOST|nr:hypothetical protein LSTR_LSTR016248 [Laodelphax striatellus]
MSAKVTLATARPSAFGAAMRPPQRKNKNEELERVRQNALLEAANFQDTWHLEDSELTRQLRRLHASWLCYNQGNECLKVLCHFMTSVPTSIAGNWQALAGQLGLTNMQMMSITQKQSYVTLDSVQLVIRTYSQNTNSNLYQIVKSLQTLKRFDALQKLKEPFQQLVEGVKLLVESDKANFIYEKINPGVDEADSQTMVTEANDCQFLIAPKNYQKDIKLLLPMSLHNLVGSRMTTETVWNAQPQRRIIQQEVLVTRQNTSNETMLQPTAPRPISPKRKVNVFLTFASDGEAAARRIARIMRTAVQDRPEFGVLILDENAEKVLSNPEILINQLFPQFHFICPILTEGYLKAINSPLIDESDAQLEMRSALDSLDAFYAKFIHNLMMNEYTENGCRNQRFRCIIPKVEDNALRTIVDQMRKPGCLNPTLRAWAYEKDLESFLRRLIGLY